MYVKHALSLHIHVMTRTLPVSLVESVCYFIAVMQGYTALDMLTESLSSKEESGQGYDLEEEHTAICELLRKEMRRRGYDPPAVSSAGTSGEGKRKAGDKRQDSNRLSRRTKTRKEVRTMGREMLSNKLLQNLSLGGSRCLLGAVGSASVS